MKKTRYGKTLGFFWDKYHKQYKKFNLDPESLYKKIKTDIIQSDPKIFSPEYKQQELLGTELWFDEYKKVTTHLFFIDEYLIAFLSKMKLSDLPGVKRFLKETGTEKQVYFSKTKENENRIIYSFAVHIPNEKTGYSFALGIDSNLNLGLLYCKGQNLAFIPEEYYQKLLKMSDEVSQFNADTFRLAINTIAYMSCFPDCIAEGVPPNQHISINYTNSKMISLSDKISESNLDHDSEKTNAPHIRSRHFRYLGSEYFTNKQGQFILVQETMINGKAKTVYTANDLSKLSKGKR